MRILLTGLVSVHWGRIENGNIGNYYIVETTIRELHRVFPQAEICTTFQMTDGFIECEKITVLPLCIYYEWSEHDVENAMNELSIVTLFNRTGKMPESTIYIDLIRSCDLVCDFSGEMWGDHAEPVGTNRFLVNLLKMRVAQLFNIPTVLLAGSQGPFVRTKNVKSFAQTVFRNYNLVLNREAASKDLLEENGFNVSKVFSYTDPAFLFQPAAFNEIKELIIQDRILDANIPTVGFILCGFNMLEGPYDKEPRRDDEFIQFVELIEYIIENLNCRVFLMSHQNGFERQGEQIKLINGRDYPYAQRLYKLITERGKVNEERIILAKGPYTPHQTKAIIGLFDIFISGRIHAFVAAVSQFVPTVIITRGHGGKSHRNIGFARSVGLEDFISDPSSTEDMINNVKRCWDDKDKLRKTLKERIPDVKKMAMSLFDRTKEISGLV